MYVNTLNHCLVTWLFYVVFQEVQLSEFLSATTLHLQAGSKSIKRKYDLINFYFARFLTIFYVWTGFFWKTQLLQNWNSQFPRYSLLTDQYLSIEQTYQLISLFYTRCNNVCCAKYSWFCLVYCIAMDPMLTTGSFLHVHMQLSTDICIIFTHTS